MKKVLFILLLLPLLGFAKANDIIVHMYQLVDSESGLGEEIGTVTISENEEDEGVLITPDLFNLPPGAHGFHLHEIASCAPTQKDGKTVLGGAAGGHYDPKKTGKHLGPYGDGHMGDLPVLAVDEKGNATTPVVAPHIELVEFYGHSLMIHQGGDNYSDEPNPLGGGHGRIACGVVQPIILCDQDC